MVESLVITLREGIEAALVVGIILAYLRKTGRDALSRFVYTGLVLAVVASVVVAAMFQALNIDPENEVMEGTMLGVAGLFVASMVVWMWRTAGNVKSEMENKLANIVGKAASPSGLTKQAVGLLVFTFLMVLREGVETVLFLGAATFGEMDLLAFIGGALGLGLAVIFAIFFVRGSLRINLSRFFNVTGVVLLLLAVKLLAGSLHEFAEVGVVPMSREVMSILGYFVRDESSAIILIALLALPMILILWDVQKRPGVVEGEQGELAAERRKRRAAAQREVTWRLVLVGATLVIILAMASTVFAGAKFYDPEPVILEEQGTEINIPVSDLEEGKLHKYATHLGPTYVRFLAVKLDDGTVATAHDACPICGSAGYMQEGENVICKNCNAPIATDTLGFGGGCNPVALKSKVAGGNVTIKISDLEEGKVHFLK